MILQIKIQAKIKHLLRLVICPNFTVTLLLTFIPLNSEVRGQDTRPAVNNFPLDNKYLSIIYLKHTYFHPGDDSTWAQPDINMTDWKHVHKDYGQDYKPGIQWFRSLVRLKGQQTDYDILAIFAQKVVSAYEIYWDGELIGKSGTVGNSQETEVPGQIKKTFPLKRELTQPGLHTLAIRLSNFHTNNKWPIGYVEIGYHFAYNYSYAHKGSHFLFTGGAFLITGLFCIAMFFAGSRHRAYLLFALYCFIGVFVDVYPTLFLYNDIDIAYMGIISWILDKGTLVSFLFLTIFIIFTYEIPKKKIFIPFSVIILFICMWLQSKGYDYSLIYNELMPLFIGGLLVYSITRKTTGSVSAFIGLLLWRLSQYSWNLLPNANINHIFVLMFGDMVFLFCIVLSITRTINVQNKMLQEITLRSSRLEVDLLKKNIQPHFILNTLQSVMNWIKKKPDNALKLIEALADEFRMINRISDKTLIPIHQEVDLCNTHLKIMGFRMGTDYNLITEGLSHNEMVPPMIFHTLIENALTHSFKTQEAGTIRLTCDKAEKQTTYRLSNNGSRLKEISQKARTEINEGMGLKYIRARLEESFAQNWNLDYQLNDEQWVVKITLMSVK